ncbi:unnamed protein product [Owenia fusiformis]|uniref:Uncharacterized protein n=1 Tax=Owenia fusiformis TaxID=6347 RepID=A0A8J1UNN0_OWEFU|nr:unnamed protein product [Owenia fusiformis]
MNNVVNRTPNDCDLILVSAMMSGLANLILLGCFGSVFSKIEVYDYDRLFGMKDTVEEAKYICADIVFLLDTSCSIEKEDRGKMVTIVETVVNASRVGDKMARFGVVTFDRGARVEFGLNEYTSRETMLARLAKLKTAVSSDDYPQGCKTYTWEALELVRRAELLGTEPRFDETTGCKRGRVVIIMTDGVPFLSNKAREQALVDTIEQGAINADVGISTMVVQLPNKNGKYPTEKHDVFESLVTRMRYYHTVENNTDLEKLGHRFFEDLVKFWPCCYSCMATIDLCYVLDRSISIKVSDIILAKEFLKELSDSFLVSYDENAVDEPKWDHAMIGVSSYNTDVYQHSLGKDCQDNACVHQTIESIPNAHKLYTETDDALRNVRELCLSPYSTRGRNVPKVTLLLTDGNTWETYTTFINSQKTIGVAQDLRAANISVDIIGLPNYQERVGIEEWMGVASNFIIDLRRTPDSPWLPDYKDLKPIVGTVARLICEKYGVSE